MMSKIKSSSFANIKVTFGFLAAMVLLIVFACEEKEDFMLPPPPPETVEGMKNPEDRMEIENEPEVQMKEGVKKETHVFFIVEEMPQFPGGEMALRRHIANEVTYPAFAQENEIQGKVYVSFVVSKNGTVSDANIARGVDPLLDQEALRVINSLPAWEPGYQRGVPVNVSYTVPINFVLQ